MSAFATARREIQARPREHTPTLIVTAVGAAFGSVLLLTTDMLATYLAEGDLASRPALKAVLDVIGIVFLVVALFTSAVVTANTFGTIVAGRTRTLALYRLVGARAKDLRRAIAAEGLIVGVVGGALGVLVGVGLAEALALWARAAGLGDELQPSILSGATLIPFLASAVVTVAAAWFGSRRVLVVTPIEATSRAVEPRDEDLRRRHGVLATAWTLGALGAALLALGVLVGTAVGPLGVLVALPGGVLSFVAVVLAADWIVPPVLHLVGRIFGGSVAARLATANARRHPQRSARSTVGLVIGIALITMFTVASATVSAMIQAAKAAQPETYQGTEQILGTVTAIFTFLIAFSVLIAAIGLANSLALSVVQRRREIGLLRALGLPGRGVWRMILLEAAQTTITASIIGLALGAVYGWVGAASLLGRLPGGELLVPVLPWQFVLAVVIGSGVLAVVASAAPARRAVRVSPTAALAFD